MKHVAITFIICLTLLVGMYLLGGRYQIADGIKYDRLTGQAWNMSREGQDRRLTWLPMKQ